MWKLLNDLSIPHVTLLDLDRERNGGGWGRIKYVLKQLNENNRCSENLRTVNRGEEEYIYEIEELEEFHKRNIEHLKSMNTWITKLEREDVYFSFPLDIDFSMLKKFQEQYESTMSYGPRIPKDEQSAEYDEKLQGSIQATLKNQAAVAKTYSEEEKRLMIWYNSLFLGRGKPSTHIAALKDVEDTTLLAEAPEELLRLLEKVKEKVGLTGGLNNEK